MEFVYNGYTLSLEAYLINGYIRLEVGFKGYEIPARDYVASEVVADINANFASSGYTFGLEWDDENKDYALAINFGASTNQQEANLANAVDILASYFPAYLKAKSTYYDDPKSEDFQDFFGDGRAVYLAIYETPDGAVRAEVITYISSKKLMGQIHVYDVASTTPTDGE